MRLGVQAAIVDGRLVPGDVEILDGLVSGAGLPSPGGRGTAVPGFVDLQVNGFAGIDFATTDATGYRTAGAALLETGVTAFQPTFITAPEEDLAAALYAMPARCGPTVLGAHLEGPFLSAAKLGAHPVEHRRDPDVRLLHRLLATGSVSQVTLAPELPGALDLVDLLVAQGITVSCGHSDAAAADAHRAFDRGARTVTHLFNAMRVGTPRDPGIALAALARPDVHVQMILDGHHLARETAAVALQAAAGRVALVTDATSAAGRGDGAAWLGPVPVEARDGVVRRADGVLAGSALTMIEAVRNLHTLGASLVDAVNAATLVPARIVGSDTVGVLAVGRAADVVVLSDELEIDRVILGGEVVVTRTG